MTTTPDPVGAPAPRSFGTVGVVGLGTMGAGIAEVFARSGLSVVGVEVDGEALDRGRQHLSGSTDRAVRRGRMTAAEQADVLGRITLSTSLKDLGEADLVVEAVVESLEAKLALVRELDGIVAPQAVLATNTSSLSVTDLAAASSTPGRVVGVHFFNPAPVQGLVEVVGTVLTEPSVLDDVTRLVRALGKNPVVCGDRAGFIANALLFGYLNRAVTMYEAGFASREDIDTAMRLGGGYPMGPLALLDLIGLDTAYAILRTMYRQGRDRLHAPAPILRQLVTAGLLGRKTGRGFYTYERPHSPVVVDDDRTPATDGPPVLRHPVREVGVVGAGSEATMVAEVLARGGYEVRLHGSDALEDLATADLVVEALAQDAEATVALFGRLDAVCRPGALLATTTSVVPIVVCARATSRPELVVGLHFAGPATQLVEVVSTVLTDPEVAETARAVCAATGTAAVSCGDRAGFLVDALVLPYLNDAVKMVESHYATADDIDVAMKQGCALPRGPFEVLDAVGTDVALALQRAIFEESPEPGLAPAPLLEQLVTAGHLGRGTGLGFRDLGRR